MLVKLILHVAITRKVTFMAPLPHIWNENGWFWPGSVCQRLSPQNWYEKELVDLQPMTRDVVKQNRSKSEFSAKTNGKNWFFEFCRKTRESIVILTRKPIIQKSPAFKKMAQVYLETRIWIKLLKSMLKPMLTMGQKCTLLKFIKSTKTGPFNT